VWGGLGFGVSFKGENQLVIETIIIHTFIPKFVNPCIMLVINLILKIKQLGNMLTNST
jgi:hypothetical protein